MHLRGFLILAVVVACQACSSSTELPVPARLVLAPSVVTLRQGDTLQVEATVQDSDGRAIAHAPVTFLSSDTGIVRVSETGLLTAVYGGPATIIAVSGVLRDTATVTVLGHPAGVTTALASDGVPHRVAISGTGVTYVTLLGGSAARIDLPSLQFSGTVPLGPVPTDVTFSADGAIAYVSGQWARAVYVIDVAANIVIDSIPMLGDPVPVRITPDRQKLYVATNVDSLFVIALPSKTVLKTFALPATSHWMAWHPNRRLLYVATRDGGTVMEIDTENDTVLRTFTLGGRTQGMAVASDGAELYVADELGGLEIWNLQTASRVTEVALSGGGFGVALSPDDAYVYVTVPATGQVHIVDRATRTVVQTVQTGGVPRGVAFDRYGRVAIVANEAGWVTFIR